MDVSPSPVTSAGRFGMAFAIAAVASAILPFVITPVFIAATGRREAGMAAGVPIGILLGWLIFPWIAWRPFRAAHLLAIPLVVGLVVAGFTLLPEHWLTTREGDRNGVYGALMNVALCALAGYGVLTWIRNALADAGKG